jgi:RNA polymerase sigma-70 factor (ECF subfamily)
MMHRQEALRYLDDLFRYAMALSRDRADAEDLVQETYARALKAMSRLRPGSNLKVWMFTILKNVWRNGLRKQNTGPRIVELADEGNVPDDGGVTDPHSLYVSGVEREQVRSAIRKLPVDYREIIILREYDGLSYDEIAGLLSLRPGTVMSRLARARAKLREFLSGTLPPVPSTADSESSG